MTDPIITRFNERAEELARQMEELRETWKQTAAARRRRFWVGFLGFVLAVYTAVTLHDQHVEHCAVLGKPSAKWERTICEATFPFHDHDPYSSLTPEVMKEIKRRLDRLP